MPIIESATKDNDDKPRLARDDVRLVRTPLPIDLIRQVDHIVRHELGGFRTRHELIEEAVRNLVLETLHGEGSPAGDSELTDEDAPSRPSTRVLPPSTMSSAATGIASEQEVEPFTDFSQTSLVRPPEANLLHQSIASIKKVPSFGLSNRDYPALLSLQWLAELSTDGPPLLEDFYAEATRRAWRFATALSSLRSPGSGQKLTALFPTNRRKEHLAEVRFQSFAIGSISKRAQNGRVPASGPLFTWQAAAIQHDPDGELRIAPTEAGLQLLEALEGLTAAMPHPRAKAEAFTSYLVEHAPWDFDGFKYLCQVVGDRPDRTKLIDKFKSWHPEWSTDTAGTNAAGYMARAREWGLVLPKLVDGAYVLSDYGHEAFL